MQLLHEQQVHHSQWSWINAVHAVRDAAAASCTSDFCFGFRAIAVRVDDVQYSSIQRVRSFWAEAIPGHLENFSPRPRLNQMVTARWNYLKWTMLRRAALNSL